jgi:hypothetical protein
LARRFLNSKNLELIVTFWLLEESLLDVPEIRTHLFIKRQILGKCCSTLPAVLILWHILITTVGTAWHGDHRHSCFVIARFAQRKLIAFCDRVKDRRQNMRDAVTCKDLVRLFRERRNGYDAL